MIPGNALIVLMILFMIALYIRIEQKNNLSSQTEAFGNMTVAMEKMTANYLAGEQQVCNSWAGYINSKDMTADAFSENVAECMAAGMNGHIAKPVDMKLVVKEIKRIKDRKEP